MKTIIEWMSVDDGLPEIDWDNAYKLEKFGFLLSKKLFLTDGTSVYHGFFTFNWKNNAAIPSKFIEENCGLEFKNIKAWCLYEDITLPFQYDDGIKNINTRNSNVVDDGLNPKIETNNRNAYTITPEIVRFFDGQPEALHLWIYAISSDSNIFVLRKKHVKKTILNIGETRWRRCIRFLKDSGLLVQKFSREHNRITGSRYYVRDFKNIEPEFDSESGEIKYTLKQLRQAWGAGFYDGSKEKEANNAKKIHTKKPA